MNQETVLVVDDEPEIRSLIQYNLEKAGYTVLVASNGAEAMSILHDEVVDLAVLDIMLPELSGTEICRRIRDNERLRNIPVLFVTAKNEEHDEIIGFQAGGDDYLSKPFSPKILTMRVESLLKRSRGDKDTYSLEDFNYYFDRHIIKIKSERIQMTPREFTVLGVLIRHRNRTISRSNLLERGWGMVTTSGPRSVDIIITRIRSKLGIYGGCIRTVTGYGYQWDEDISV